MTREQIEDALRRAGVDPAARFEAALALVRKQAEEAEGRQARREADQMTEDDARAIAAEIRAL